MAQDDNIEGLDDAEETTISLVSSGDDPRNLHKRQSSRGLVENPYRNDFLIVLRKVYNREEFRSDVQTRG